MTFHVSYKRDTATVHQFLDTREEVASIVTKEPVVVIEQVCDICMGGPDPDSLMGFTASLEPFRNGIAHPGCVLDLYREGKRE